VVVRVGINSFLVPRGAGGQVTRFVSSDIVMSPCSPVFNSQLTAVLEGGPVAVVSWYHNEWGYSSRRVELAKQVLVHAHA
jgi:glyceraldehyde-3-phosphate dehydrogenase/erythrose-4-phosphate dehydrogenase